MDKKNVFVPRPINTVLEGNKNYLSWSQAMRSFLKGCMLGITVLVQSPFLSKEQVKKMLPSLVV